MCKCDPAQYSSVLKGVCTTGKTDAFVSIVFLRVVDTHRLLSRITLQLKYWLKTIQAELVLYFLFSCIP